MLYRLRVERLKRRLTIDELADLTDVATPHVSYIERGRMIPSERDSAKLVSFFGLPADVLFARVADTEKAS